MAITFTWSVNDMHKVDATGAVFRVNWRCSGTDEDTSISHTKSGSYLHTNDDGVQTTPDHTAEGFVAYDSLKEADVLVWVKADGEGARTEALLTNVITAKIAGAASSTGVPW